MYSYIEKKDRVLQMIAHLPARKSSVSGRNEVLVSINDRWQRNNTKTYLPLLADNSSGQMSGKYHTTSKASLESHFPRMAACQRYHTRTIAKAASNIRRALIAYLRGSTFRKSYIRRCIHMSDNKPSSPQEVSPCTPCFAFLYLR